jgi:exonuclease SbcC
VAEAISLAIAIYNARRSAIPILDLWRDECSGALHPDSAPLYVTMLRQALSLGGFHRVYFVSHQPDLWRLADARLLVDSGQCRVADAVELPPRAATAEAA